MTSIDSFLDLVKSVLTAGVAELSASNTTTWHAGAADPDEDIANGCRKCQGVSALIYDLGGDNDPEDATAPVILCQTAIELFIDPTKRRASNLRTPGAIRDAIMLALHGNATLQDSCHYHMRPRVTGYRPLADPSYTCFRITLQRSIYLH
jgi:hypothetical protein